MIMNKEIDWDSWNEFAEENKDLLYSILDELFPNLKDE